jgi:sorbitol-specific phosphotransferase system component IIBC
MTGSNTVTALFVVLIALGGISALVSHFHNPSAVASAVIGIVIGAAIALVAFSRTLKGSSGN